MMAIVLVTALDPAIAARLKRNADGLVPAVVQQHDTGEVLMLGWMDDEALAPHARPPGRATYWSRSRAGVLGQGRDLRPPPVGQGGPPRLRRRHAAGQGRPGGRRPATPATAPASTPTCCCEPMAEPDGGTFGAGRWPLGLSSAAVAAVAWPAPSRGRRRRTAGGGSRAGGHRWRDRPVPLATALALVVLACWGVVLVTRGRVRRAVAVLGALAAVGRAWPRSCRGWCAGARRCATAGRRRRCRDAVRSTLTGWCWVAPGRRASCPRWPRVARGACWSARWPEMGSRYDAPAGRAGGTPAEDRPHLDLWKALDQGQRPHRPDDPVP